MPTIRIDNDVMHELEARAVDLRLVFGTPNQVLRILLSLDDDKPVDVNSPQHDRVERLEHYHAGTGPTILKEHKANGQIDRSIRRGHYHKDGHWYEIPKEFPAVFFDTEGYLIVNSRQDLENNSRIAVGVQVNVRGSIKELQGYVHCTRSCI